MVLYLNSYCVVTVTGSASGAHIITPTSSPPTVELLCPLFELVAKASKRIDGNLEAVEMLLGAPFDFPKQVGIFIT